MKTEHKATLDTCRELEREGYDVTYLDVMDNAVYEFAAGKGLAQVIRLLG